ncbi:urea carboxylase [Salinisphaera sp. Q1T1-3]|uniref:urea carboxylase n=1 Tax=Salinisphaera sp. Q1T1-3 TaxID=2321229 RepID=UPI000E718968|nr:urea carboxylase [Salinisphaera sp. Q1T1-3]RJS94448.1 urea carboxylase [Salinisphaera sp. Q1T1-3]
MLNKILIANRGAIATRIQRTCRELGVASVAVYAEADRHALFVQQADEAYSLGEGSARETYLDIDKLLAIAVQTGAEAIHPGYGFLSENEGFIRAVEAAGLVFLGPTPAQVRAFGLKHEARQLAERAGVPLVPGSALLDSAEQAVAEAERIGYPVMLKSTAGGGGIGMKICHDRDSVADGLDSVRGLGQRNFGDAGVFVERYIERARHLEVQLFGDGQGRVVALGERDCSSQRRNQKVVEECPAPALPVAVRDELLATAVTLGESIDYRSAGTVEFIYDADREAFYFLEVNTRLQVEHGVTECVWGVDIVAWMIELGAGGLDDLAARAAALTPCGHAIQARLYAEDPHQDYRPSAGLLTEVVFPDGPGVRIDHAIEAGFEVSPLFDPMLAKLIVHRADRAAAIAGLGEVLADSRIYGIETNLSWLAHVLADSRFTTADFHTRWLADLEWAPPTVDVLDAGTMTTIQDWPGRTGAWDVGVPPSGPFDDWSFRLGNRLLGNDAGAAGLEITLVGPQLRFNRATRIVLAGAAIQATLDEAPIESWQVVDVAAGAVLKCDKVVGGVRAYLLAAGGIDCPTYLGSRATFTLGQFGGHAGRALRAGDVLALPECPAGGGTALARDLVPRFGQAGENGRHWEIGVVYGPHGAPDFFTEDDIETIFGHDWEVHFHSNRTGIRLKGPRPEWAREDGGEAGLHPSNIHDNAYAFGTIDFTGDMPVILGPDGPSLGGFVCPATTARAERWKLGQLGAGDTVRFVPISIETARGLEQAQDAALASLSAPTSPALSVERGSPVVRARDAEAAGERLVYRRAGDDFLLLEFGEMELAIKLRFRAHAWMLWLRERPIDGMQELTPGIRSLQIHYDPRRLSLDALMAHLAPAEAELRDIEDLEIESRIVHLPLSWDDPACQEAIDKYQRSVRPDAPWCPSNLDFIKRINGLDSHEDIRDVVFNARYLVMGLGDVYLGAPVATPLDPRQRLVTTKYNPARTWTAENSVGIGGAYLCVYGMEGPGGYQFVGRTLQVWNRYRETEFFDRPWLLRFFDQLRFYEVSHDELMDIRSEFLHGRFDLKVEKTTFSLAEHDRWLADRQDSIDAFREQRQAAFEAEMAAWRANGQFTFEDHLPETSEVAELADDEYGIDSPVSGSLWKLEVAQDDDVAADQLVAKVESMKMEVEIRARRAGRVSRLPIGEGGAVSAGQPVVILATP